MGLAQVVGAVAAAATGQSANNVMIAASLGADAAVNNYLLHATGLAAINSACHSSQSAACSLAQNVSQSQAQLTSLHKGPWEIVQNVDANGNIVAYSAYNPATGKTDWVMDPADLPGFMRSNTGALQLSSTAYYQSPDYAVSAGLATQELVSGNYQSGLRLYGQSWGEALTNPGWWASVVAGTAGGAVEAETAAAARAGETTGSVAAGVDSLGAGVNGTSEVAASSGLSRSAIISNDTAQAFLVKNGMSVDRAKDFVASFYGPITARVVSPGENFVRYTDVANSQGSFLTKTIFPSYSQMLCMTV